MALGAKRRRRPRMATSASTGCSATAKPEKIIRFAEFSEWYDIVDDGTDDFTFDNTCFK